MQVEIFHKIEFTPLVLVVESRSKVIACIAGTMTIVPSSRPQTKRPCVGM